MENFRRFDPQYIQEVQWEIYKYGGIENAIKSGRFYDTRHDMKTGRTMDPLVPHAKNTLDEDLTREGYYDTPVAWSFFTTVMSQRDYNRMLFKEFDDMLLLGERYGQLYLPHVEKKHLEAIVTDVVNLIKSVGRPRTGYLNGPNDPIDSGDTLHQQLAEGRWRPSLKKYMPDPRKPVPTVEDAEYLFFKRKKHIHAKS